MGRKVGGFQNFKRKFRPQQTSIAGGSLLLLSSGIHMGFGFFHWENIEASWTNSITTEMIALAIISWFVGSMIGLAAAPTVGQLLRGKLIYFVANGIVALSAILLIAVPKLHYTVIVARFVAGLAHGLAYVILIQHYGEVVVDNERGRKGAAIHLFLLKGGIISCKIVITFLSVEKWVEINRFLGICSLVLSFIATMMTIAFYTESPASLIQSGDDRKALENFMHLRRANNETHEITESFKKLQRMIAEEKFDNPSVFCKENANALIVVILLRLAYVLTYNFATNYIYHTITADSNEWFDYTFILTFLHTFTVVIVLFTIDKGRRLHFMISAVGTSIILITFGCLRIAGLAETSVVVFSMFLSFEIVCAIGIGITSHIYSAEAFSTLQKPGSVAFTAIIEYGLQIMFVLLTEYLFSSVFDVTLLIASGSVMGLIAFYLYFKLPETKNLSIYEARKKFL